MDLDRDLELILLDLEFEEKENKRYLRDTKYWEDRQLVLYKPIDYSILNYLTLCMNIYLYLYLYISIRGFEQIT